MLTPKCPCRTFIIGVPLLRLWRAAAAGCILRLHCQRVCALIPACPAVIMSTEEPDISDAFLVAATRICGILLGVFLSLSLSVIIFPRSASHQVGSSLLCRPPELLRARAHPSTSASLLDIHVMCKVSSLCWTTPRISDTLLDSRASRRAWERPGRVHRGSDRPSKPY